MPKAYVIASIDVKDAEAYRAYREQATPTVEKYGGRYLVRGGALAPLEGEFDFARLVVLEFPSLAAARAWYDGPEYGPLRKLRQASADSRLVLVEGCDPVS